MKKGFTLSEVLITLSVVGVVAVLTIPGVMKNYRNRLYVASLEKVYAQISDAAQAIMNDEHVDNFYETTAAGATSCTDANNGKCEAGYGYFLTKYFKAVKYNCKKSDKSGCVSSTSSYYKTIGGAAIGAGFNGDNCIQTASGAAICGAYNNSNKCLSLSVDVNGMAEPNIPGRDIFVMDVHKNGTISDYLSGCADGNRGTTADKCTKGDTDSIGNAASGCLNNVIEAGWKMEY